MNLTSKFKFNNLLIIYDLLRNGYSQKIVNTPTPGLVVGLGSVLE
jgi:hypothetical protein